MNGSDQFVFPCEQNGRGFVSLPVDGIVERVPWPCCAADKNAPAIACFEVQMGFRVGRHLRYKRIDVDEWIEEQRRFCMPKPSDIGRGC